MQNMIMAKADTDKLTVLENEPMSRHTSWRAGGAARRYIQTASKEALAEYIAGLGEDEPLLWMGLGSNTLVRDGGFNGTVIATQGVMTDMQLLENNRVYAGAGVPGAKLARFCSRHGLSGAEFFAGIPGLLGGALAMNAGAFGGETWPLVVEVETMNRKGEIIRRNASEFSYGYRHVEGPREEWFVSATLQLQPVKEKQAGAIDIKALLAKRSASQPTGVASCGSVFRNPQGDYAARLIESCGLKGRRIGGAVVSAKHANFIINDRNATAADIESLIELVQREVEKQQGVLLQTEVRIVGDRKEA
ncbi:MAG TPA: UDP-N-acetylmuramate dehydrogenase [Gammaproteobacteria bacterium]|nr:UDP-N-acetylmuramate dehydrogenase [Gammaproteobacteria bacterium]